MIKITTTRKDGAIIVPSEFRLTETINIDNGLMGRISCDDNVESYIAFVDYAMKLIEESRRNGDIISVCRSVQRGLETQINGIKSKILHHNEIALNHHDINIMHIHNEQYQDLNFLLNFIYTNGKV